MNRAPVTQLHHEATRKPSAFMVLDQELAHLATHPTAVPSDSITSSGASVHTVASSIHVASLSSEA
jgi:hypothetical protein